MLGIAEIALTLITVAVPQVLIPWPPRGISSTAKTYCEISLFDQMSTQL